MSGLPVERLRVYLRQLPQAARALLIAELERAVMFGEEYAALLAKAAEVAANAASERKTAGEAG